MKLEARVQAGILLFLGSFVLFAFSLSDVVSQDLNAANFGAWHLAVQGSPWIENAGFIETHPERYIWVTVVNGHEVIARSPGVIIFSLPTYWLSQLNEFNYLPGGITAALMTAGSTTLVYLTVNRRLSIRASLAAAVVFALATPIWAVAADGMWPHTITVFGIAGMAWAASNNKWWLVGLFGGIALTGRVHTAIIVAILGLGVGLVRKRPDIVAKVGIPSVAFLVLTGVWNNWLYGHWNPTGAYRIDASTNMEERYVSLWLNQLGLWISPGRGILVWTPALLLMIPAVVRSWRELPDWSKWLAIGGFCYTLAQGWANVYHGGEVFWSYRLGLEFVACVTPMLAFSIPRVGSIGRRVIPPVVVLQALFLGIGAVFNVPGVLKGQAWVSNPILEIATFNPLAFGLIIVVVVLITLRLAHISGLYHKWPRAHDHESAWSATDT